MGTIFLYLDYQVPFGELREELKRLVEKNENWNGDVCKLQVTDTKPNTVEVRALVGSADVGKSFDLRCEVREGLIEFLRNRYPESLPHLRMTLQRFDETAAPPARRHAEKVEGQEHESGTSAPGLKKPENRDGPAR
ncbi:MAG: hypothetical protein H0W66_07725 [Chthoniobacterales bacterium]|nr:hypothetical protein [Chthoniobacterales bacterium]